MTDSSASPPTPLLSSCIPPPVFTLVGVVCCAGKRNSSSPRFTHISLPADKLVHDALSHNRALCDLCAP